MITFDSGNGKTCSKCGYDRWMFLQRKSWCAKCGHKWGEPAKTDPRSTNLHEMMKSHNAA